MKIAIDLNDVVRDYTLNFAKYYATFYDKSYEISEDGFWTNDITVLFPFSSDRAYEKFAYEDYAYEIYGKCPTCGSKLTTELNEWFEKTIKNIDIDEPIEVMFVSTMEYGLSIQCTLFFLSKIGSRIREYYFPTDSLSIWDKCDVLITANPRLLENKPENKVSIKINTDYNEENVADYTFSSLSTFLKKEDNVIKLLKNGE